MNFKYRKFRTDPDNCPFPQKKVTIRPIVQIDFLTNRGPLGYSVLIDSGADFCMFHAKLGEALGMDIKTGKCLIFVGTSGHPQRAYFHKVKFLIGGVEHECYAGFSDEMEKLPYGLLGQDGFFDKWNVKFEYSKENIELKPAN